MKATALSLALLVVSPPPPCQDTLGVRVVNFDRHYDVFVRDLFGCPAKGPITEQDCRPQEGRINYAEYQRARKAAAALFDFNAASPGDHTTR